MAINDIKKTRIVVNFENETVKKIEDYQFENRIKSRNEAIRQLVDRGLEKSGGKEWLQLKKLKIN